MTDRKHTIDTSSLWYLYLVALVQRTVFSCTSLTVQVFPYRADRRIVGRHIVGRGCGMTRSCVLGANARFPTEYDGNGNGLMRLAGHMPMVGTREEICNTPRQRPVGGPQITRPAAFACASCVNSGSSHVLLCAPVPSRPT